MNKKNNYLSIIFYLISCLISDILIFLFLKYSLIIRAGAILLVDILYLIPFFFKKTKIIYIIFLLNIIPTIFIWLNGNYNLDKSTNFGWEKYTKNPVLGNIWTGSYFDPYVTVINDEYYMYFSNRKNHSIVLSKSTDGINWDDTITSLDHSDANNWEKIINRATVLQINNKFYMWYTGQNDGSSSIGYAESDDGITFHRVFNDPIMIAEFEFEKQSIMNPNVIYDTQGKLYKMWYAAGEQYEPDCIGYAESIDGIHWNKRNEPVLTKNNNENSYDFYKVGATDVRILDDGTYLMFYIGYTDINTGRIMYATSMDGINWKRGENFIIQSSPYAFDNDSVYKPTALYDEKNQKWMLWYNGRTNDREFIGYAECLGCTFNVEKNVFEK